MNKKLFNKAKEEIATKHRLGTTLVTGHKAVYWEEAADLYATWLIAELQSKKELVVVVDDKLDPNEICCDGCGYRDMMWNAIDNWCILDGKQFCRGCQRKKQIGWYAPKTSN